MNASPSPWPLRVLIGLGSLSLIGFAWWALSIPSTPNLASQIPTPNLSDPVRGPSDADVTVIEFGDFQCEFCQELDGVLEQVLSTYGDRVRLVWKDFPVVSIHPEARNAATAARCAQQQFKFWEFHDALFDQPDQLGLERYSEIAKQLGLNETEFAACLRDEAGTKLIDGNVAEAARFGISSTPTLFIGRYVLTEVPSFKTLDGLIRSLLSS